MCALFKGCPSVGWLISYAVHNMRIYSSIYIYIWMYIVWMYMRYAKHKHKFDYEERERNWERETGIYLCIGFLVLYSYYDIMIIMFG